MKKKLFLKFFLFTVLATLVTFTSCKNYDDDIDNLQGQIKELATKSEMTSQLATLQSALAAAQTDASKAMTEVQKLAGLEKKVTDMMAELETTNAANFEAQKEELNTLMATLKAEVEDALGLMLGMVFDVELIPSEFGNNEIPWITTALNFSSAYEKDNVFEENIANAITFVKDKQVQTGTSFIIRVSPTNVIVTPEMISFQNSLGQPYDNVKVTKVVPYEGLLTRSTANGGGLWEVFVELENYNAAAFKAATEKKGTGKVLFAVAVNNTDEEAPSKVISTYDIQLNWSAYTPAGELFFFVGDKHVKDVNNRFSNASKSLQNPGLGTVYAEKKWSGAPSTTPVHSGTGVNTTASSDNRSLMNVYPAVQGKAIKIALTEKDGDTKATAPSNIRGMYVTLDKDNAIESAPSELNAWKSYSYTGLNTVVTSTEASITIDSKDNAAIDDIIGFRVFAVNHDGTLVDPDGKAFYVSLGKPATDWTALNTVITATEVAATSKTSAKVDATLTKLTGATKMEWTTFKADGTADAAPTFNAYFVEADGTSAVFNTATLGTIPADFSKAAKVYTMATDNDWLTYKDNHVYNGKLTIKNGTGHVLASLDVTFKKVLPTTVEGFSVKTSQLSDGVWNAYLIPNTTGVNWTTPTYAATGEMLLSNVFNFGTTDAAKLLNFETTFAASSISGTKTVALTTKGTGPLEVAKSFIDNETEHATEVKYNFGKISTETKDASGPVEYKVSLATMKTVYNNIYNSTYTWNWATREQLDVLSASNDYTKKNAAGEYVKALPYSDKVTYNSAKVINLYHIYGVSTKDETAYNAPLRNPFKISSIPSLKVMSATFVSANGVEEYFTAAVATDGTTITLTPVSATSNPTADVPTTLKIVAKDIYGNDVKIDFPMTVKPS